MRCESVSDRIQVSKYSAFRESEHPRDDDGRFSDKDGAFWRIHDREFTKKDIHNNHRSKVWLDQDDENTKPGLSVTKTLDDLVNYFAGHRRGGSSAGRGATLNGAHLVQIAGHENGEVPYEEQDGERLIEPHRVLSSTPVHQTPFLGMLKKRIDDQWAQDGEEFEYNPTVDDWKIIPKGTHGWSTPEREALGSLTPSEFKEIISSGPEHEYWDSIEQMKDFYPEEFASITRRMEHPPDQYSKGELDMNERIAVAGAYCRHGDPARYGRSDQKRDESGKWAKEAHSASEAAHEASNNAGAPKKRTFAEKAPHEEAMTHSKHGNHLAAARNHEFAAEHHEKQKSEAHAVASRSHREAAELHHKAYEAKTGQKVQPMGTESEREREYAQGVSDLGNREAAHRRNMEAHPTFAEKEHDRSNSFLNANA